MDDDDLKSFYLSQIKEEAKLKQKEIAKTSKSQKRRKTCPDDKNLVDDVSMPLNSEIKVSEKKQKLKPSVEVVVFKRKKYEKKKTSTIETSSTTSDEVDSKRLKPKKLLEKLQWDVTSFGLKAYSKDEKRKLEEERAVKLGAKPRKRPYVNYKVLMEEKIKQKEESESSANSNPQPSKKKKQKTKNKSVFWQESLKTKTFGQVGNFQNGVLKLSSFDVKSVKRKVK